MYSLNGDELKIAITDKSNIKAIQHFMKLIGENLNTYLFIYYKPVKVDQETTRFKKMLALQNTIPDYEKFNDSKKECKSTPELPLYTLEIELSKGDSTITLQNYKDKRIGLMFFNRIFKVFAKINEDINEIYFQLLLDKKSPGNNTSPY